MSAVPVYQALFWPGGSPVSHSGEVDFRALARSLARSDYWAPLHGRFGPRRHCALREQSALREPPARRPQSAVRQHIGVRRHYSRAQHAVIASRAVETLAVLKMPRRRVLAMHVWLAELRDAELNEPPEGGSASGKKRLALRFMELEALADVLARTVRWNRPTTRTGAPTSDAKPSGGTVGAAVVVGAAEVDGLLLELAGLDVANRNRLALHALFSELLPSGLGPMTADAVLRAEGLDGEVPEAWVEMLRFIRRMADETARRDLPRGARIERTGFPALEVKIEPLGEDAAARLWLERHRVLTEAKGR